MIISCVLDFAGCGVHTPANHATVDTSSSTANQVCKLTAKLFTVDQAKINAETSLGDLDADELDFVELVMELEEQFDVSIPDETAERMMGTSNWQQGMKNITMAKLASIVDELRQTSRVHGTPKANSTKQVNEPISDLPLKSNPLLPPDVSQSPPIKVFLNPLVMLLAGAEKQKGRALTREEVLEVRDKAAFVLMTPEQARKFYSSLDAQVPVNRLNPDRVWEEWQEIRGQLR